MNENIKKWLRRRNLNRKSISSTMLKSIAEGAIKHRQFAQNAWAKTQAPLFERGIFA